MFTSERTLLAALVMIGLPCFGDEVAKLGEPVDPAKLEALDFTVLPDGSGLPAGSGDAIAGAKVYQQHCLACHGERGQGGINDALVGGQGSLTGPQPTKTVGSFWPYATTVFDYVRRAMPLPTPGVLTDDEVYAVTAYLLYLNEVIEENAVMNAETLPAARMPNRDNFRWGYPPGD